MSPRNDLVLRAADFIVQPVRAPLSRLVALGVLAWLLLSACAPRLAPPPSVAPVPPEMERVLMERLQHFGLAYHSLQGLAKVRVEAGERSLSATQVIFAQKPDRLRAETLNPFGFGQPVLLLATDGVEMSVLVPGEGEFYRGEPSPGNLQRFIRMPLRLADLVHILLYQAPVIGHDQRRMEFRPEGGYLLELADGEGRRQQLGFDRELRLVEAVYYRDEELMLRIRYGGFAEPGGEFPSQASLEVPSQQVVATLAFSEVQTNVEIPAERFALSPPPGYRVRSIP
ncbi:hypothetical protein DESUT3_24730 [Desulfuromonas versatilis]|uniref:DUF4292 domain-containing protein n=1 Tax=Desulfuromonas versatilis TaxID=2802975 RepID=A0ABM8HQS3_9BACT|nr:hypothetical protein [Desulfuromonas versatilis]BCR05404.1 hypothetical protein DESUT3_24730 [Desulfuromonas versatilis]